MTLTVNTKMRLLCTYNMFDGGGQPLSLTKLPASCFMFSQLIQQLSTISRENMLLKYSNALR